MAPVSPSQSSQLCWQLCLTTCSRTGSGAHQTKPSLLYDVYRRPFPEVKRGRGVTLPSAQAPPWCVAYFPCSIKLLAKLTVALLVKNLRTFYGIRRFITVFTRARHRGVSCGKQIQPKPRLISVTAVLILSSPLCPVVSCPYISQNVVSIHQSHSYYSSCRSQPPWSDHFNNIWWGQITKSLMM